MQSEAARGLKDPEGYQRKVAKREALEKANEGSSGGGLKVKYIPLNLITSTTNPHFFHSSYVVASRIKHVIVKKLKIVITFLFFLTFDVKSSVVSFEIKFEQNL